MSGTAEHGEPPVLQAASTASAYPMQVAAPEDFDLLAAVLAARSMGLAGPWPGVSWPVASQQPSVYSLPPVPVWGDPISPQAGTVSYPMSGYNCAVDGDWQPSAASPVLLPPPLPLREQPSAQGPVRYPIGMGEVSAHAGRGANSTPYATVPGNSSARVQAPVPGQAAMLGTQVPQATPSAGMQKAHDRLATTGEPSFGSSIADKVATWLRPESEACPSQVQPATAGDPARDAMALHAPQQKTQQATRLAAVTHSADQPAADGGLAQNSGSPGPLLPSTGSPARAPHGAEPASAEPEAEQLLHAHGGNVTEDNSSGSLSHPADDSAALFGCFEPSVEELSSHTWSLASTVGSHSQSEAASGSQVAGYSTGLPPLSPASKAASPVPSCTGSLAAGSGDDARRSGLEHAGLSPPSSVAASVDAAHSGRATAWDHAETELGRVTVVTAPLGSDQEPAPRGPVMAGSSFVVRVSTPAIVIGLSAAAGPCVASQPPSPASAAIAARIADVEAAHEDLLDTAPADRLPFEELVSPEGSPEPEGLPEGIAEGLLDGSGEDEDGDPVEGAVGACAEPAAAVGPAARPKRTAGGDPMDVRIFSSVSTWQHAFCCCHEPYQQHIIDKYRPSHVAPSEPMILEANLTSMSTAQNRTVRYLVNAIVNNSTEFEADGRVLRLKQYLGINMRPPVIDAILTALEQNTLVEALYIQNFEEVRVQAIIPQKTQCRRARSHNIWLDTASLSKQKVKHQRRAVAGL